jgi:enoyl-CoA hydratase/carnithine racemase
MAIRLERQDAVATLVMDRPEARNAVDGPAASALAEAFREFEQDGRLRVAVLWGAGGSEVRRGGAGLALDLRDGPAQTALGQRGAMLRPAHRAPTAARSAPACVSLHTT